MKMITTTIARPATRKDLQDLILDDVLEAQCAFDELRHAVGKKLCRDNMDNIQFINGKFDSIREMAEAILNPSIESDHPTGTADDLKPLDRAKASLKPCFSGSYLGLAGENLKMIEAGFNQLYDEISEEQQAKKSQLADWFHADIETQRGLLERVSACGGDSHE
ncbi:MAG: hypothetical protein R8M45_10150 [Ghiorsea sp.]